jgi:hypothetical protein
MARLSRNSGLGIRVNDCSILAPSGLGSLLSPSVAFGQYVIRDKLREHTPQHASSAMKITEGKRVVRSVAFDFETPRQKKAPKPPQFATFHFSKTVAMSLFPHTRVRYGSRLCKNFNVRRARRNIFEKLRNMRTDNAADIRLNAMLGNCIFYISPMYEFSHSLGH